MFTSDFTVLTSSCYQHTAHYQTRIRGSYAIIKIFWGMRGMGDRSSSRYKHFNQWIIFLESLTASWSPIILLVMGEEFALWALLHQLEGFIPARERQRWGQWLQPDPSSSYTSTMSAEVCISFTNEATGQEIPPWVWIPPVPGENCYSCKPDFLQPLL